MNTNEKSCSTCMGGQVQYNDNCKTWLKSIGRRYCASGRVYANKSECEALLEYWDHKEGSVEEWRRNNVPMKKWNDRIDCIECMGHPRCEPWLKKCGMSVCCGVVYANKAQTEALLKWHDDRYGSIEQARKDSEKDKIKRLDLGGGCWIEIVERDPEEMKKALRDAFDKKESPKPFATLEEFDLKIIKMFIERRKIKFHQLCLGLGLEREDTNRIIAGIK